MEVEVVVLVERSNEELRRWTVADRSRAGSPNWRTLALELVRRARRGLHQVGEIYLCYRGDRVGEFYDHDFLEVMITQSREHGWGAAIHLVFDNRERPSDCAADWCDACEEWFRTALRSGVAGLLQIKLDSSVPADCVLLRSACDRARDLAAKNPTPVGGWKVALTGKAKPLERCRDFLGSSLHSGSAANLLLVVADDGETSQTVLVEEALGRLAAEGVAVATAGVRPEPLLQEYCTTRGLNLLWFRGLHELKYFLLRSVAAGNRGTESQAGRVRSERSGLSRYEDGLREALRSIPQEHPVYPRAQRYAQRFTDNLAAARERRDGEQSTDRRRALIEHWNLLALSVLGVSFDRLCIRGGEVQDAASAADLLLVTTSLDPAAHEEQCLVAAHIAGRLLQDLPPAVVPRIHLACSRQTLGDIMVGMPSIAGWIYIGLAAGERGLQEACSGEFVQTKDWLPISGPAAGRLPFILLLAGGSGETARQCAELGGAATAIGFGAPDLSEHFTHPAKRVLHEILRGNRDRWSLQRILRAVQGEVFIAEGQ